MDHAQRHESVLRLGIVDAVAAQDRHAGFGDFGRPALDDLFEHLQRQRVTRKIHHVQGEDRPGAHGVHVAQGVGRRDPAPGIGIVDDGRDVVDRGDQSHLRADLVYRGVISQRRADQHLRVHDRG